MDYGRKSELYLNSSGPVWTNIAGRDGIRVQREHLDQVRWQESRVGSGSHREGCSMCLDARATFTIESNSSMHVDSIPGNDSPGVLLGPRFDSRIV
ncbi:hypothetical protein H9L39_07416 [Fusarium oxysporum f. sp. albedinis]|nr:hypothetical protein H9L39_07416 [Fusarium oxysporum f. sp. albedinis]